MKNNSHCGWTRTALILLLASFRVGAQDIDCEAYANHAGIEPPGYADACLAQDISADLPTTVRGDPGAMAFAHELRNTRNTVFHAHEDLSDHAVIGLSTSIIFGYDYSPDLATLYGINWGTGQFGTSDGITFTAVGTPTRPAGHTWSGLAIDPISGEAYLSSTNSKVSTLQSVDLATGESTLISNMGDLELVIEIAINCDGAMYAHDIGTDAIYTIDRSTGNPTLIGAHGLETNFAQGMDFNNQTGDLYIYAYTGGGSVTYGRVNLSNGTIIPLNVNDPEGEWEGASHTTCPGRGPARFRVSKDFDDDNPAAVAVAIQCNTGLPLAQQATLTEGEDITFVVDDFEDGELACEITETVPQGYGVRYDTGETSSTTACRFEEIEAGSLQSCEISNSLAAVDVEVTKVWIDENPLFNAANHAMALWNCTNVAFTCEQGGDNSCHSGRLEFQGNPAGGTFRIFPSWNGGTHCSVSEVRTHDRNIEVDESECSGMILFPGTDGSCTIFNTRLYAGIPALGSYGVALLLVLMLGLGLIGAKVLNPEVA